MAENTCKTCPAFARGTKDSEGGTCRAEPPVRDNEAHRRFPLVNGDLDWCMKHPDRRW